MLRQRSLPQRLERLYDKNVHMYCLIVKRGDFGRYDQLYKMFGNKMPVIWERRKVERRSSASGTTVEERRQSDRRGPPPLSWPALGFLVANRP